jgi:hypothetical protein
MIVVLDLDPKSVTKGNDIFRYYTKSSRFLIRDFVVECIRILGLMYRRYTKAFFKFHAEEETQDIEASDQRLIQCGGCGKGQHRDKNVLNDHGHR